MPTPCPALPREHLLPVHYSTTSSGKFPAVPPDRTRLPRRTPRRARWPPAPPKAGESRTPQASPTGGAPAACGTPHHAFQQGEAFRVQAGRTRRRSRQRGGDGSHAEARRVARREAESVRGAEANLNAGARLGRHARLPSAPQKYITLRIKRRTKRALGLPGQWRGVPRVP